MLLSIDRFEDNNLVVLEDEQGTSITLPKHWLPPDVNEGDMVKAEAFNSEDAKSHSSVLILSRTTNAEPRKAELSKMRASLPRVAEGDISL